MSYKLHSYQNKSCAVMIESLFLQVELVHLKRVKVKCLKGAMLFIHKQTVWLCRPGLQLTDGGRRVQRWSLGSDEGRDGPGWEESGVLLAHLQRGHGAAQGELSNCCLTYAQTQPWSSGCRPAGSPVSAALLMFVSRSLKKKDSSSIISCARPLEVFEHNQDKWRRRSGGVWRW